MSETGRGHLVTSRETSAERTCSIPSQDGGKQDRRDVATRPSAVALTCHPPERKIVDAKHCQEEK
jgi:hypothetical protein